MTGEGRPSTSSLDARGISSTADLRAHMLPAMLDGEYVAV
jgi:hypothetical protein